jgi:hypothetical protein
MSLEQEIRKKYTFVVIQNPQEIIPNPQVRELFPKVMDLKTAGYRQEYGNFVLPFDSSDFIATHLLLCEKGRGGDLHPLLGMKSVTLKNCDAYRIAFPMLGMLETPESKNEAAKAVISDILDGHRARGTTDKVAYNGSFTIRPELRKDEVLKRYLWELTFSMLTNYYISYEIDHVLAVCATRFKVHERKAALGWNYIKAGDRVLEEYKCRALFESPLVPMEIVGVKEKSAFPAARFRDLWDARLTLDAATVAAKKQAA